MSVMKEQGRDQRENEGAVRFYDQEYFELFSAQKRQKRRINNILAHIPLNENDVVCEFGCGIGHVLFAIQGRIRNGVGLDFSEHAIRQADLEARRRQIGNLEFRVADIESLCSDESYRDRFDKVFMMDVAEHIGDETLASFLESARHTLKPGGELYIHTPNAAYYIERLKANNRILKQTPGHIAVRYYEDYDDLLKKSGFVVKECFFLSHYNRILGVIDRISMRIPLMKSYFESRILIRATLA